MADRLVAATIVVAVCFGIGLLIFLPARWLAFRNNPGFRKDTVSNSTVAAWIGVPVLCVYAFAIDPVFGATLVLAAFLFLAIRSIVAYAAIRPEQKRRIVNGFETQGSTPYDRVLRFVAYGVLAIAGFMILKGVLS